MATSFYQNKVNETTKDLQCGICLETVPEMEPKSDRRYGIMQNCNHTFCFKCIQSWRQASQDLPLTLRRVNKSCPICRRNSNIVAPCLTLITDPMEKEKLIEQYRVLMKTFECETFKQTGYCPEGISCLYRHIERTVHPASLFSPINSINLFALTRVIWNPPSDQFENPPVRVYLNGFLDNLH